MVTVLYALVSVSSACWLLSSEVGWNFVHTPVFLPFSSSATPPKVCHMALVHLIGVAV